MWPISYFFERENLLDVKIRFLEAKYIDMTNKSQTISSCRSVHISLGKKSDERPGTQIVHPPFLNVAISFIRVRRFVSPRLTGSYLNFSSALKGFLIFLKMINKMKMIKVTNRGVGPSQPLKTKVFLKTPCETFQGLCIN